MKTSILKEEKSDERISKQNIEDTNDMECGAVYGSETWTMRKDDIKKTWGFWNVDLEKNGESQLDRTKDKNAEILETIGEERFLLRTIKTR